MVTEMYYNGNNNMLVQIISCVSTQLSLWEYRFRKGHGEKFSGASILLFDTKAMIESQGVACLWMADAGSKLKVSLLSKMLNVSKEDLLNPWGSALTPVRKSRQLEWIVLFLSSLCMQMCSEGESAFWETQQDLPKKKALRGAEWGYS